ncbi:hypothetical protein [Actinoallomurus sp. NPDC050550]|uniref:hypothetical protein n=1 Tax=Actinoallomurus sp. NPDC050550 TaxID=3154937 RepID=UPI0033C3CFE0
MRTRRGLALVVGAAALIVGGATAAGVAYAAHDDGRCVTAGPMTKAVGPAGDAATDDKRRAPEDGPSCVPAEPAVPASK